MARSPSSAEGARRSLAGRNRRRNRRRSRRLGPPRSPKSSTISLGSPGRGRTDTPSRAVDFKTGRNGRARLAMVAWRGKRGGEGRPKATYRDRRRRFGARFRRFPGRRARGVARPPCLRACGPCSGGRPRGGSDRERGDHAAPRHRCARGVRDRPGGREAPPSAKVGNACRARAEMR